jgi:VIT1/CCC1 family predicted Fe2+/Mn2+ transporter
MTQPQHSEAHFEAPEIVRDIIIGMSDGLTVPFALAAGLTGVTNATGLVVTAGLAEIAAGSIAMGLGGYLAAKSESDHYQSEVQREEREIVEKTAMEEHEVREIFMQYGLAPEDIDPVIVKFKQNPEQWVNFMMKFELGLEKPDPRRARNSAITIAFSYIAGGIVPLLPYMIVSSTNIALQYSVIITLIALFIFGYAKSHFLGTPKLFGAIKTTVIGALAAGAAFLIAKLIA